MPSGLLWHRWRYWAEPSPVGLFRQQFPQPAFQPRPGMERRSDRADSRQEGQATTEPGGETPRAFLCAEGEGGPMHAQPTSREKSLLRPVSIRESRQPTGTVSTSLYAALSYDPAGSMPPRTRRPPRPPPGRRAYHVNPPPDFFHPTHPHVGFPHFPPRREPLPAVCRRGSLPIFSWL
jgi:hypothetical protein